MTKNIVDVTQEGGILLGKDVVCDGLYFNSSIRVQSHIHIDHMDDFDTCKGIHTIVLSPQTYDLLKIDKNSTFSHRSNIKPIQYKKPYKVKDKDSEIVLLESGHMLGAVQTQVSLGNGERVGYSGDFNWPLKEVIKVDKLVIDSTNASPNRRRTYNMDDIQNALLELVSRKIKKKSILLTSFRGTLQYVIEVLNCELNVDFICESKVYNEIKVYERYGYDFRNVINIDLNSDKDILKNNKFIFIKNTRKSNYSFNELDLIKIKISAYRSLKEDINPIQELNKNFYTVSLSSHADFEGTLEYVKATGAKEVIVDNTRNGNAIDVAEAIKSILKIKAYPSTSQISNNWHI